MHSLTRILIGLTLITVLFSTCRKKNEMFTIGIVQIIEDKILDDARASFVKSLEDQGYQIDRDVRIVYQNAQGDIPTVSMILQSFVSSRVDLVVTLGTPCQLAAIQSVKTIPIIYTVAFSAAQMGIAHKPDNLTGVYDPCPIDQFFEGIHRVTPSITKLGLVYNTAEVNALYVAGLIKNAYAEHGFELVEGTFESTADLTQVTEALVRKGAQAVIAAADNRVYAAIESILRVTNREKIPFFTTEINNIDKGLLAAVGPDCNEWAYKAGQLAGRVIRGESVSRIPEVPLGDYNLVINLNTAEKLGISLSDEVKELADSLYQP
ncbi:MAG: ABC transporter substrate-binding protein [Candidatus Delongbacteria bacterium]|nr:ABC transporter substrate-binding protein [Candidatus Delongbacteria bacterium]